MALYANCLLFGHEDMNWDHQYVYKKSDMEGSSVSLAVGWGGRRESEGRQNSMVWQSSQIANSMFSERPCLQI